MTPPWKKPAVRRAKMYRSTKTPWMPHWRNIKKCLASAASSRKAEIANAKREINKALSAEQLHIRRDWTARQSRLKEKLFAEVREQILKFMESSRYEEYLCTKIEEAVCFAEHDEIQIYLSKAR